MDCMNSKDKLHIVYGDGTLGVHGKGFDYIFSYGCGGPESLVIHGKEWLYRTPRPTFWRALTDNDRGSKFHLKSGMWLSADMFLNCIDIKVRVDGEEIKLPIGPENNKFNGTETADNIRISFTYETITVPSTQVEVAYEVKAGGKIRVDVHYHGNSALPELPVFGMRFILPTKAVSYKYEGLSGETYPDRMAGGIPGVYEIEGLPVTPYLVPQDCNVHMETKWLEIRRNTT
ncbi:MAG: beta-galactosidase small subunit, partial [Lachnospiraceae bacterium]